MRKKFNFLGIGEISGKPFWRLPTNIHKYHEIIVIIDGKMSVISRGNKTTGGKGEVFFIEQVFHTRNFQTRTIPFTLFLLHLKKMIIFLKFH